LGCFNLPPVEYEDIPAKLVGYWDGVVRLIPVFVIVGLLIAWRGWCLIRGILVAEAEAEADAVEKTRRARKERLKRAKLEQGSLRDLNLAHQLNHIGISAAGRRMSMVGGRGSAQGDPRYKI
jgi:hypothetical protein